MFRRRANAAPAPQDLAVLRERAAELEQEGARLKESEERSRALFELAPDAYYVCDLDPMSTLSDSVRVN